MQCLVVYDVSYHYVHCSIFACILF